MKTWIRFYDNKGQKSHVEYMLNGVWLEKSVDRFIAKRPHLKNLKRKVVVL